MIALAWILVLPLDLAPAPPGATQVDAFFDEWAERPKLHPKTLISGEKASATDLSADVQLSFDDRYLFFAVQTRDDAFVPGGRTTGDRLELRFVAAGKPYRIDVALNGLEDVQPTVHVGKKPIRGVKMAATERRDGWAIEFAIPLRAVRWLRNGPISFAAVFTDTDADPVTPETVAATAVLSDAGDPVVATFELGGNAGLIDAFTKSEGDPGKQLQTLTGQVIHGGPPETFLITDKHIVIVGHGLPQNAAYMYFSHGWRQGPEIRSAKLKNVDGRPGVELILEHSEWAVPGETQIAVTEIYGVHEGYLKRMFAQKVEEATPKNGAIARSELDLLKKRGAYDIRVRPAKCKGFNEGNYVAVDLPGSVPFEPLPMPWEGKAGRRYALQRDVWNRK